VTLCTDALDTRPLLTFLQLAPLPHLASQNVWLAAGLAYGAVPSFWLTGNPLWASHQPVTAVGGVNNAVTPSECTFRMWLGQL
jgi:hypothetical protein